MGGEKRHHEKENLEENVGRYVPKVKVAYFSASL